MKGKHVPDLVEELRGVLDALQERDVPHALCGGLAMAIHGHARATVDIDLLILAEDVDRALAVVRDVGFTLRADPMEFAGGVIRIVRVGKLEAGWEEPLPLDLLTVTPPLQEIWDSRERYEWEGGELWAVSRRGLIQLKRLRDSHQDRQDIEDLEADGA